MRISFRLSFADTFVVDLLFLEKCLPLFVRGLCRSSSLVIVLITPNTILAFLGSCVVKSEKIASKGSLCKHIDDQLFPLAKDKAVANVGAQEMPHWICIVANVYKEASHKRHTTLIIFTGSPRVQSHFD